MEIIINKSLMIPIYLQIVEDIKKQIRKGELVDNDNLPSVRSLSRDLKISALTVKKAYDCLEREGLIKTIHGKGSYVSISKPEIITEEQDKEIERELKKVIQKARLFGLENSKLESIFKKLLQE